MSYPETLLFIGISNLFGRKKQTLFAIGYNGNGINYLKSLAYHTGGTFYRLHDYSAFTSRYSALINIDIDNDGDGLPDYYESNIPIYNGNCIVTSTDIQDTDGDGLKDGDEIIIRKEHIPLTNNVRVYAKMLSDPRSIDSDGDGVSDAMDARPLKNDIKVMDLQHQYTSIYNDGASYGGDQKWFKGNEVNQNILKNGCALIGITDIMLYLLRNNINFSNSTLLSDICETNDINNDGTIKLSSYFRIVKYLESSYFSVESKGLSPYFLPSSLNRLASDYNWNLKSVCPHGYDICIEYFINLVYNDIPVLLFLGGSESNGNVSYQGIPYYNIHNNVLYYDKQIISNKESHKTAGTVLSTGHAVVITGIVLDGDEYWLKASNHGKEVYVNFQQLLDYIKYTSDPFNNMNSTTILRLYNPG